jgi:hypothetical protein
MGLLRERVEARMVPQARIDRRVDKRRASHPLQLPPVAAIGFF